MATKFAVVTGAGSGMGKLMAQRLIASGWDVAAVDLPGAHLEEVAARTGASPYPCDVSDADQVAAAGQAILEKFGALDRLVCAAGIARVGRVEDMPVEQFERSMSVNYFGTVSWVKTLLPAMRARGTGDIVLFASLAAWMPTPALAAYTATKFAVVGFAETLTMELHGSGIRVRCVCPGPVETPMLDDFMAQGASDRLKKFFRPSTPEQVIDAVEASLARRHRGIFVFPNTSAKVLFRATRFTPRLLAGLIRRIADQ